MFSLIPNTQQALENMFIFSYTRPHFYSFKHISVQKKSYPLCQWRNKNAVLWRFKNVVFRR